MYPPESKSPEGTPRLPSEVWMACGIELNPTYPLSVRPKPKFVQRDTREQEEFNLPQAEA